jgi:transposase
VQQFLAEKSIPVITQPPYSPDLAPSEFRLFPILKMGLKGTRFATLEDIKSNATAGLRKIPKEAFRRCFEQ